jgi:hypothetical protein
MKAEDGYRVVSIVDRERYDYPRDCDVRVCSRKYFAGWFGSRDKIGWKDGARHQYVFAVPESYVFVEDRGGAEVDKQFRRQVVLALLAGGCAKDLAAADTWANADAIIQAENAGESAASCEEVAAGSDNRKEVSNEKMD